MYNTNKRITAVILLCGQLLTITSCNNYPDIPTQPKIYRVEKKIDKEHSKGDAVIPLLDSLVPTSADGQKLILKYENKNWQAALITEDGAKQVLPIVVESGYSIPDLIIASKEGQQQLVHLVASKKSSLNSTYVYIGKEAYTGDSITNQAHAASGTGFSHDAAVSSEILTSSTTPTDILILSSSKGVKKDKKLNSSQGNSIIVPLPVDNTKQAIKRDSPISVLHKQYSASSSSTTPTYKEQQPKRNRYTLSERRTLEWYKKEARDRQSRVTSLNQVGRSAAISDHVSLAKQLTEEQAIPSYIAKGGHQVYPVFTEGQWMGVVKEDAPVGFSRAHYLKLYLAPGFSINELRDHSPAWQQAHIGVVFPEKSRSGKGHVYIGEGGLLGGGNSGSKGGGGNDNDRTSSRSESSERSTSGSSDSSSSSSGRASHNIGSSHNTFSMPKTSSSSSSSHPSDSFKAFCDKSLATASAALSSSGIKHDTHSHTHSSDSFKDFCDKNSATASATLSSAGIKHDTHSHTHSNDSFKAFCDKSLATASATLSSAGIKHDTHSTSHTSFSSHASSYSSSRTSNQAASSSNSESKPAAYKESSTSSKESKAPHLTLENAATEVRRYIQETKNDGPASVSASQQRQAQGEQLLKQLREIKQQQERSYSHTQTAYITPGNSEIGNKLLLDQLTKKGQELSTLKELESELIQSLERESPSSHYEETIKGREKGESQEQEREKEQKTEKKDKTDKSYSMKVDGKELNPDNFVLNNSYMAENVIKLYKALVQELKDHPNPKLRNFQFKVTGGDRYIGSDGKVYSSTDHSVIRDSGPAHLRGDAVDLRIKLSDESDIVPLDIIEKLIYKYKCTKLILDYKALPGRYPDKHYHLQLPKGYKK